MKFNDWNNLNELKKDVISIIELSEFMDDITINEGVTSVIKNVSSLLPKLGLHVKQGEGLIHILGKASKNVGQLIWHAIKAFKGDEESKLKVKELSKKEITKEQILDFLLKLDTVTLHLITGPIHMIDALTGWHIWADINKVTKPVVDRVNTAIEYLNSVRNGLQSKLQKKLIANIDRIKKLFGV